MTQIDPQVKAKIEEIVEDINDTIAWIKHFNWFCLYSGHNEKDPTILKLMDIYHNHSDLI